MNRQSRSIKNLGRLHGIEQRKIENYLNREKYKERCYASKTINLNNLPYWKKTLRTAPKKENMIDAIRYSHKTDSREDTEKFLPFIHGRYSKSMKGVMNALGAFDEYLLVEGLIPKSALCGFPSRIQQPQHIPRVSSEVEVGLRFITIIKRYYRNL